MGGWFNDFKVRCGSTRRLALSAATLAATATCKRCSPPLSPSPSTHPLPRKVPFGKSFRATIRSHASLYRTPHDTCKAVKDMDCWGNDLYQKYNIKSAGDCCSLCKNETQCGAYTFHPDGTCFLKTRCGGMQPSKGNTTGALDAWTLLQGVAFPGAVAVGQPKQLASAYACADACDGNSACAAFSFDNNSKLCTQLNGTAGGNLHHCRP